MSVHLIRRYYKTRPRFLYFAPQCRIKADEIYLKSLYRHSHSPLSHSVFPVKSSSSNLSSLFSVIERNASSQLDLGCLGERRIMRSVSTSSSISSLRPVCSRTALGMRIPCEFPILTMLILMSYKHLQYKVVIL